MVLHMVLDATHLTLQIYNITCFICYEVCPLENEAALQYLSYIFQDDQSGT